MATNLAEAQDHSLSPEAFLSFHRDIAEAKRDHEDSAMALSRVKKAAKAGSVDLSAYAMLEKIRKLESDEQIIVMRHFVAYATYLDLPVGAQFSLMDAPKVPPVKAKAKADHEAWQAGEEGLRAGRLGEAAAANPYAPGTQPHVAWVSKHRDGLAERATAAMMETTEHERPTDTAEATSKAAQGKGRGKAGRGQTGNLNLNGNGHTRPQAAVVY